MSGHRGMTVLNERITQSLEVRDLHAAEARAVFGRALQGQPGRQYVHHGHNYIREYAEFPLPPDRWNSATSTVDDEITLLEPFRGWHIVYPSSYGSMNDDRVIPFLQRELPLTQAQRDFIAKLNSIRAEDTNTKAMERMQHEITRARATLEFYGVEL